MTTCCYIYFIFEYLREFETEFENILGHESGGQVVSIHEKKQRSKISCYCPFKEAVIQADAYHCLMLLFMPIPKGIMAYGPTL